MSEQSEQAARQADSAAPTSYLKGPEASRPTHAELCGVPYDPPFIVADYLPVDACGDVAPGGVGKSTLLLYEAVHIILSRKLYGLEVVRSGAVLFISAEDSREISLGRLNQICRALELSEKEYRKVMKGLYFEDVSSTPAKLVEDTHHGVQQTPFYDEIVATYKEKELAMVVLDPTSHLGPGELSGNDGMAQLMRTARGLTKELSCAVRVVHHVAQAVARAGTRDQYVARGATAFADNSRAQHQFTLVNERNFEHEGNKYVLPPQVTDDHLAHTRRDTYVIGIYTHKLSHAPRSSAPIILIRRGFAYEHVPLSPLDNSPYAELARSEARMDSLIAYIADCLKMNVKIGRGELDKHAKELGMTREQIRDARDSAEKLGLLVRLKLPDGERRTRRTSYLAPAPHVNAANCAESRRVARGINTKPDVSVAANGAADGTSTRRRDSGGGKVPTRRARNSPPADSKRAAKVYPKKGLNGVGTPDS